VYGLSPLSAVDEVQHTCLGLLRARDGVPRDLLEAKVVAPKGGYMRRAVEDGGAELAEAVILEYLEDELIADAVDVAMGDGYTYPLSFHVGSLS